MVPVLSGCLTEMVGEENRGDLLQDVARFVLLTLVIVVVVVAVDMLVLSLFGLGDGVKLKMLFFYEAFAMMLLGAAGWGFGEHVFIPVGWKKARIYHLRWAPPTYVWVWLSVAMAGVLLLILAVLL